MDEDYPYPYEERDSNFWYMVSAISILVVIFHAIGVALLCCTKKRDFSIYALVFLCCPLAFIAPLFQECCCDMKK